MKLKECRLAAQIGQVNCRLNGSLHVYNPLRREIEGGGVVKQKRCLVCHDALLLDNKIIHAREIWENNTSR